MAYCNRTQILVVDTVNWETVNTLRYKSNTAEFTVCRYSPCGNFLAAGTVNGDICVWRVRSGEAIDVVNKDDVQAQPITTLDWNAHSAGEMAYTDNSGQLGTITYNAVDDSDDEKVAAASGNAIFDDGELMVNWKCIIGYVLNVSRNYQIWTTMPTVTATTLSTTMKTMTMRTAFHWSASRTPP